MERGREGMEAGEGKKKDEGKGISIGRKEGKNEEREEERKEGKKEGMKRA